MKKRISWITGDFFIDVDLPIIVELSAKYDIFWQIIISPNNTIDYQQMVDRHMEGVGGSVNVSYVQLSHRARSPKLIADYWRIVSRAKKYQPDLFYIAFYGMPYALPIFRWRLPLKKCIVACHNVTTPKGAGSEYYARIYTKAWLHTFKNIQVFSAGQEKALRENYSGKCVLCAPLAIKNYGDNHEPRTANHSQVVFLFFGNIVSYKRLDILLEAANLLYDEGIRNFRVKIAGSCHNWSQYEPLLRGREIFDTDIRRIPNEEIAKLFESGDFFVMPYQDIAQSGAMMVAVNYSMPVIASDLPSFRDVLHQDETAFFFESGSVVDLANQMKKAIGSYHQVYDTMCYHVGELKKSYLPSSISLSYDQYFRQLMGKV